MRHVKRCICALALLFLLLLPASSLLAAGYTPGNVSRLVAVAASETSVKLTWSKASNATQYNIYQVNPSTGRLIKRVAHTSKTTYTLKNLTPESTYVYQVYAYRKVNGKYYRCVSGSPKATVKVSIKTPANVSNFRVASYGDRSVMLKWKSSKNATGYVLYLYNSTTKTYKRLVVTKELYHQVTGLKAGTKYTFVIRPYRIVKNKVKYGAVSSKLTATAKSIDLTSVHGRRYIATVKSTTTATVVSTGKKMTLKKGTKIYAASKKSGTINAETKSGVAITVSGSKLSYGNLYVQKNYYSRSLKENFINSKGYTSNTNYLIWINQYTLNVTVFKGSVGEWKQVRSAPCVVGGFGKTPVGNYKICRKSWAYGGPCIYFTYNSRTGLGNSFHRRIDGNTRAPVSSGCIRLADSDLNYINNNCAIGTRVVSY